MERRRETLDSRVGVERGPHDEGPQTMPCWRSTTRRMGGRVDLDGGEDII